MIARNLRFARAPSDGKVEIQDPSSGEAAALQVIPDAKHPSGDAEILRDRLNRIASTYFVVGSRMSVGTGIDLFAGGDWDDQTGFRRECVVTRTAVKIVGFGDGLWSRVIGAGDGG